MLNNARHRAMERLFGLPEDQVNAATVIAALVLAEMLHERARRLASGSMPSMADSALGATAVREGVYALSGQFLSDTPLLGSLIAIAVIGSVAQPAAARTLHLVRVASGQLHATFNHRYGHLIRHGQHHLRRASSIGRPRRSRPAAG